MQSEKNWQSAIKILESLVKQQLEQTDLTIQSQDEFQVQIMIFIWLHTKVSIKYQCLEALTFHSNAKYTRAYRVWEKLTKGSRDRKLKGRDGRGPNDMNVCTEY